MATKKTAKTRNRKSRAGVRAPRVVTPEVLDAEEATEASDEDTEEERELELEPGEPEHGSATTLEHHDEGAALPAVLPERGAPPPHDLLRQYLEEASRYPLLTPEEEFALAAQLKEKGDLDAARQLVRANLRLVVKIAMEYRSAYQNVMDLIQEGNIGLLKAVSKFDPAKGARLSYYASWWIRSYILKYILDNFRLVRLGTTQAQKKLFFHLVREKERLEAQGLDAGPKLLADKLNVREQDVIEMGQRLSGRGAEMSLDNPIEAAREDGGSRATHLEHLAGHDALADESLERDQLHKILKSRLDEFAKTLKEKELAVFQERLAAEEPKTLQEVADHFGLTRERARQIEARVIEKLRAYYAKFIR